MGSSSRPTILSVQVSMSMHISLKVGCQISQVAITEDPITSYGSRTSSGGIPMTDVGQVSMGSSPCRTCVISVNLGGGHGGLWLDCSGIISQGRVVGASVFSVEVGQLSPWTSDRDPLGQAQQLKLQLQGGLAGWVPLAWVSSPPSNWMAQWP